MTQISDSPLRSDRNAMRVPSGDHDGSNSNPGECVSRVRSVPSASMVHTSSWLSNAIRPDSELDPPPLLGPDAAAAAVVTLTGAPPPPWLDSDREGAARPVQPASTAAIPSSSRI
jgi:hypothetical protein